MPRHFIYIINPISGAHAYRSARTPIEQVIAQKTKAAGIQFDIFPSVAGGDYDFLHPLIKEKKVSDVVIAGGDGTVSRVVKSLMGLDLNFGIIPCGSGNGLAYTVKIPPDPEKALNIIFRGNSSLIDGFTINDPKQTRATSEPEFACMLAGLGFDAKVAYDFAQQPGRGLSTYVRQVVKNFFSARTYAFELQIGGKALQTEAYFISVANSNQFGNNFTIAPKASLSDGLLDIVIVTKQNKLSLLLQTFKQIRGGNRLQPVTLIEDKKGVIYFQTDLLTIMNISSAPLHIDGDPAETPEKLIIEIKKKCFRLIQP